MVPYIADINNHTLKTLGTIHCLAESNTRYATEEFFVADTMASNLIGGTLIAMRMWIM